MGDVIAFPKQPLEPELDLVLAVDFAIRDLRDILKMSGDARVREQARDCLRMLERAFEVARREDRYEPG